ncbi:hypothetical protein J2Z22_002471 [Paenibacillus forsythiae]|uniref:Uncharacterized protein n=1 Tax=Paenibacillus forsythiae TaxID=365616 RepID=A0ABU3H7X9_9BACL|nr:hypothetical protein [Paenibacillus forsythiae]
MNEYVFAAVNLDETVAFFCVKPFYCTFQVNNLLKIPPYMANNYIILQSCRQSNPSFHRPGIICFSLLRCGIIYQKPNIARVGQL